MAKRQDWLDMDQNDWLRPIVPQPAKPWLKPQLLRSLIILAFAAGLMIGWWLVQRG